MYIIPTRKFLSISAQKFNIGKKTFELYYGRRPLYLQSFLFFPFVIIMKKRPILSFESGSEAGKDLGATIGSIAGAVLAGATAGILASISYYPEIQDNNLPYIIGGIFAAFTFSSLIAGAIGFFGGYIVGYGIGGIIGGILGGIISPFTKKKRKTIKQQLIKDREEKERWDREQKEAKRLFHEKKLQQKEREDQEQKKKRQIRDLKNFTSRTPEALLQNIVKLHQHITDMIENEKISEALDGLQAELRQYDSALELLSALELEEILEITRNKRTGIKMLTDRIQYSILSQEFQELFDTLQELRQTDFVPNFTEMGEILTKMRHNLTSQLDIATRNFTSLEQKKIQQILEDVIYQQTYNKFTTQFNEFERKINLTTTLVDKGDLQESLLELRKIDPSYQILIAELTQITKDDKNQSYLQLFHKAKELMIRLHDYIAQIKTQYKSLALGQHHEQISFPKLETSEQIPKFAVMNKNDDMASFISALDRQFTQ